MNKFVLEIGIGLIILGLIVYILGIFLFLDRGMLAIGNVIEHFLSHTIDLIFDGSSGACRIQECLGFLYEVIKGERQRVLLPGTSLYHHWMVHVHNSRVCLSTLRRVSLIQIVPGNNIDLRTESPRDWRLPKIIRRSAPCCQTYGEWRRQ